MRDNVISAERADIPVVTRKLLFVDDLAAEQFAAVAVGIDVLVKTVENFFQTGKKLGIRPSRRLVLFAQSEQSAPDPIAGPVIVAVKDGGIAVFLAFQPIDIPFDPFCKIASCNVHIGYPFAPPIKGGMNPPLFRFGVFLGKFYASAVNS